MIHIISSNWNRTLMLSSVRLIGYMIKHPRKRQYRHKGWYRFMVFPGENFSSGIVVQISVEFFNLGFNEIVLFSFCVLFECV